MRVIGDHKHAFTRYTHTPFEVGSLADVEAMVELLVEYVRSG